MSLMQQMRMMPRSLVHHLLPGRLILLFSLNCQLRSVSVSRLSEKFLNLSPDVHHFSSSMPSSQDLCCPIGFDKEFRCRYNSGVHKLVGVVKECRTLDDAMTSLESSALEATTETVCSAIWALRDRWKAAFWVFLWGRKLCCDVVKASDLMIWVLGDHRKFNIAWCLIRDLHRSSVDCQHAMLVMMDRYAAANEPSMSIRTFWIMDKFRISYDISEFHTLLSILCGHGNIEEAEELVLVNKKVFPLETESFNIVLNGWCNVSPDIFEAKRVWRVMAQYCITPNAGSYDHMISCFSKVGNLFDSVRLYNEMKKRGWVPTIVVYNSLISVLAHENCFEEAFRMLNRVRELGLRPDSSTFDGLIRALSRAKRKEEARSLLADMKGEGIYPSVESYHAFLEDASFAESMEVLDRMRVDGCAPHEGTFLLLLRRVFKLNEVDNAIKVWSELKRRDIVVNSVLYGVFVEGLILSGWLEIARGFYVEMISAGFIGDPKLISLLRVDMPVRNVKGSRKIRRIQMRERK